jgi:hypothetical protein
LLFLNLSLWLCCITESVYWLFLHPLDILLYMVFWEITKYSYFSQNQTHNLSIPIQFLQCLIK